MEVCTAAQQYGEYLKDWLRQAKPQDWLLASNNGLTSFWRYLRKIPLYSYGEILIFQFVRCG